MIKPVKTLLLTITYNEEKLLPFFIDCYKWYVDKMIFYDGMSTDNSLNIINSYKNLEDSKRDNGFKYVDIEISDFYNRDDADEELFLEIKNNQWKQYRDEYDYALIVDVDEILKYKYTFESGVDTLIEDMRKNNCTIIKPNGYSMISLEDKEVRYVRTGFRDIMYDKCCLFNMKEIQEINYLPGAHKCNPVGNIKYFEHPDLKLLHYKYIGLENHLKRTKMNRERLSPQNKVKGWGVHNLANDNQIKSDFMVMLNKSINVINE